MELRQLEYFLMVCEVNSFTRAAERLYVSQPAVTSAIKSLEDELGIQLFDRTLKQAVLTSEGQVFYKHIQYVMHGVSQTLSEIDNLKNLNTGTIVLGITPLAGIAPLPQQLAAFAEIYPDIQIKLTEGDSETLQRKLIDEDIELAVLFPLSHMNHLRYHLLQQDELVICCSRNHPFRRKNSLSMQDIAQEKLVILKQGCSYRQLLINYFESVNTLPAIQFEVDQIDTIKSLVANSNLVTILPSQLCEHHQDLVIIPFEEPIMIESSLVYKDKRSLSHAAKALINALVPDATKHLGGENNEA